MMMRSNTTMTQTQNNTVIGTTELAKIKLDKGGHKSPKDGMCLMEAVAYLRRQPFSDHPQCVAEPVAAFGRSLNDLLPDDKRQQLIAFIPDVVGTTGDKKDDRRAWIAIDWI